MNGKQKIELTPEEIEKNNRIKTALKYHVHSPSEQAENFRQLADHLRESGGVTFGNSLDNMIRPLIGGDLVTIIARTGHAKTTLSLSLARSMAEKVAQGELGNESSIILFVTLEQQVEYIELMLAGNEEFDSSQLITGDVNKKSYMKWHVMRPGLPLWVIGESRAHAVEKHEPIYLEGIIESVEGIVYEYGKKPLVIFVDYLQKSRLRDGSWKDRNSQIIESAAELENLAIRLDVPIIVGSQAGKQVDSYKDHVPKLGDSMWASEATHYSSIVFSILRPSRYHKPSDTPIIEIGGKNYDNDDNTLIVTLLKQRFAPGWGQEGVSFTPQTLALTNMDTADFNSFVMDKDLFETF